MDGGTSALQRAADMRADGDVLLCCSDGVQLKAHAQLLSLHSSVLKASLQRTRFSGASGSGSAGTKLLQIAESSNEWEQLLASIYLPSSKVLSIENAQKLAPIAAKYELKRVLKLIGDRVIVTGMNVSVVLHLQPNPKRPRTALEDHLLYLHSSYLDHPRHIVNVLDLCHLTGHAIARKKMDELLAGQHRYLYRMFSEYSEFPELSQGSWIAIIRACAAPLRKMYKRVQTAHQFPRHKDMRKHKKRSARGSDGAGTAASEAGTTTATAENNADTADNNNGSAGDNAGTGNNNAGAGGSNNNAAGDAPTQDRRTAYPKNPELRAMLADGDVVLQCSDNKEVRVHACMLRQHSEVLRDLLASCGTDPVFPLAVAARPHPTPADLSTAAPNPTPTNHNTAADLRAGTNVGSAADLLVGANPGSGSVPTGAASQPDPLVATSPGSGAGPSSLADPASGTNSLSVTNPTTGANPNSDDNPDTAVAFAVPVAESSASWLAALAVMYPLDDDGGCPANMVPSVLALADKYDMQSVRDVVLTHWSGVTNFMAWFKNSQISARKMQQALPILSVVCSGLGVAAGAAICSQMMKVACASFAALLTVVVDALEKDVPSLCNAAWWLLAKQATAEVFLMCTRCGAKFNQGWPVYEDTFMPLDTRVLKCHRCKYICRTDPLDSLL